MLLLKYSLGSGSGLQVLVDDLVDIIGAQGLGADLVEAATAAHPCLGAVRSHRHHQLPLGALTGEQGGCLEGSEAGHHLCITTAERVSVRVRFCRYSNNVVYLWSRHDGHLHVREDDVHLLRHHRLQPLAAVLVALHPGEAHLQQHPLHQLAHSQRVIHHHRSELLALDVLFCVPGQLTRIGHGRLIDRIVEHCEWSSRGQKGQLDFIMAIAVGWTSDGAGLAADMVVHVDRYVRDIWDSEPDHGAGASGGL